VVPLIREIGLCGPKFAKLLQRRAFWLASVALASLIAEDGIAEASFDSENAHFAAEL